MSVCKSVEEDGKRLGNNGYANANSSNLFSLEFISENQKGDSKLGKRSNLEEYELTEDA